MSDLRGLYAITPNALAAHPDRLHAAVEAALQGGAVLIQYRDKHSDAATRQRHARTLNDLCRAHGAGLIINDDLELAEAVGAAGVHLGAGDGSVAEARYRLGADAVIGATCGPWLERARIARDAGASYVAFGRFFTSNTKPDAPGANLDVLRSARSEFQLPICAIGGVTPDNGQILIDAGADLLAAIEGVFGDPDPRRIWQVASAYARLFAR